VDLYSNSIDKFSCFGWSIELILGNNIDFKVFCSYSKYLFMGGEHTSYLYPIQNPVITKNGRDGK